MRGRSAVNWRQVLASDGNGAKIASPPRPVHLHYGLGAQSTPSVHLAGPDGNARMALELAR